jgi:protein-glutamine gamma-glutamyltransferase
MTPSTTASFSQVLVSGAMLSLGLVALQLARLGNNDAVGAFATAGAVSIMIVLLSKFGFSRIGAMQTWADHPRGLGVTCVVAMGGMMLAALSGFVSLANEEKLMSLVLCAGAVLFAMRQDASSMKKVAVLGMLVTLFALPAIRHEWRFGVILVGIGLGVLMLLFCGQARMSRAAIGYGSLACFMVLASTWMGQRVISPRDDNPWYAAVMPTSGGPGEGSESARRGVGDGPDEIAGNSPDSIGFDQSDNFSESAKDGLYDLWIESYGEPLKDQDTSKMVGLRPQDVNVVVAPDRENLQVGRQFELRRKKPEPKSTTRGADVSAQAALFVKGPMPVYVPLVVFHEFDGSTWTTLPLGTGAPAVRVVKTGQTTQWLEMLQRPLSPAFGRELADYSIKIGDLGQSMLPLPPYVERFRMGKVNRTDFFAYTRSGLVRMTRRSVPAGATLEVQTQVVVPGQLRGVEPALPRNSDSDLLNSSAVSERVHQLAKEWSKGHPRGWRQIEAVLNQLRLHVAHDRTIDTTAIDRPVEHVLFESRRGSDHHIASAAVMMLRSLGYATRLTSGLFADESHVDPKSGYAVMSKDNVHFWLEVRLSDGTWITLDATPGFPAVYFPRTASEWAVLIWTNATRELKNHWMIVLGVGVFGLLVYVARKDIYDVVATLRWQWRGKTPVDTLRLLELRARLAGKPRQLSKPVAAWLSELEDHDSSPFVALLDRVLYSGQREAADPTVCQDIAKRVTRRSLFQPHRRSSP